MQQTVTGRLNFSRFTLQELSANLRAYLMVFLICFLSMSFAFADDNKVKELFENTFYSDHYQESLCATNITSFVQLAHRSGIDVSRFNILYIDDFGELYPTGVKAYRARNQGSFLPDFHLYQPTNNKLPIKEAGEINWLIHVVLEVNGMIYDFDYTNEPKVVDVKSYFEDMFMPRHILESSHIPNLSKKIKNDYTVEIVTAAEYFEFLRTRISKSPYNKTSLNKFLKRY